MGALLGVGVVLAAVVAVAVLVLYQVVRQQGRMLLRIDQLEEAVGAAVAAAVPVGPPVGSSLESFTLPDLEGRDVSLPDPQGRRVLLVNWSPTCGYCDLIAPDLAALQLTLDRRGTELVLLSHGSAVATRDQASAHGIRSPILLLDGGANPAGFRGVGTPAAVVVDAGGRVAVPLTVGADKVADLVRQEAGGDGPAKRLRGQRPVAESRLVRDGIAPGTPAPPFTLPDVYGAPVSLDQLRGRRILLTFTDPNCGPCEALAPHLVRIDQAQRAALTVVLVARGPAEDNRKKAEEHGFTFPVVVQEGWTLSRRYGIFETPVGFLIDEEGIVARPVARGVDEIVSLVSGG